MDPESVFTRFEYSERSLDYAPHFHNAYEMVLVTEGRVRMCFERSCPVAGPRTLVFISNLEEHSVTVEQTPYKRYFLTIPPDRADGLIQDAKLLSVFKNRPPAFENVFDVSGIFDRVTALFAHMLEEYRNPGEYSGQMAGALFRELLICVYRNSPGRFPLPGAPVASRIYEIQRYIDRHFTEPVSMEALSKQFYMTPCYLSHRFREMTGYSPKQYLMRSRLTHARDLLSNSDLPVARVAQRSGFTDVNHFIRCFKAQYGTTPGQLRPKA